MRILLALPWLLAAACSTPSLDLTPRLALLEPEGSFGFNDTGGAQVSQDLQDNFGLEKDSSSIGLRADLDLGAPHLTASIQGSTHDGQGRLSGEVEYDGEVIDDGASVSTGFDLTNYSFIATWDLIPTDLFELGLGLGANLLDIRMDVQSNDDPSQSIAFDELAPVPVVAVRVGGEIGPVSLSGLASGLSVSVGDLDATYIDLDLMAKLRLLGDRGKLAGSLAAGWRHTKLDAELDDEADQVDLDLAFSGPWFGATIGF